MRAVGYRSTRVEETYWIRVPFFQVRDAIRDELLRYEIQQHSGALDTRGLRQQAIRAPATETAKQLRMRRTRGGDGATSASVNLKYVPAKAGWADGETSTEGGGCPRGPGQRPPRRAPRRRRGPS